MSEPSIPVPPEYDDEQADAYRQGALAMAQLFRTAAETHIAAIAGQEEENESDGTCNSCGSETLRSVTSPESDLTPDGQICPECEL